MQTQAPDDAIDLATILDAHLGWIGDWHRAAFFGRPMPDRPAATPEALQAWRAAALKDNHLVHQPAIERLVADLETLHRLAHLVLLRVRQNSRSPNSDEYDAVMGRFQDLMGRLRRVERAFAAAASALDPLTGLRTRRGLSEELAKELNRFRRTGTRFCLAIADIDRFKSVNDRFGHDVGDRVLAAVAGGIERGIRSFDEAFRMGGEEFLICLKNTATDEGVQVLDRLRQDIAAIAVPLPDGGHLQVTASFGLAEAMPGVEIDELLIRADRALYQAKESGRNRLVAFFPAAPDHSSPPCAPPPPDRVKPPRRRQQA